jgi:mono/diheme cytochrome c family protein
MNLPRYFAALAASLPAFAAGTTPPSDTFENVIRPLLAKQCYACHTATRLGGLDVSTRQGLLKGGNSGPAIVPGDPARSLLIQAVNHSHARLRMPPTGRLTPSQIEALSTWIGAGAPWPATAPSQSSPAFWSFQPIRQAAPPAVDDPRWNASPVDRFLHAQHQTAGIHPVRRASKRVLLRRATFDLTGLPPTPADLEAFENDASPNAFANVVDRLLASPRYGERWGRYWLDLARYADGALGASNDTPFSNAYRYRDWVIQSFNDDLPYNAFVKAQIAADLLPDSKHLPALGFQSLGGNANDQLDVTTRTFLALTVACAQCHDHKYDPIPTRDYYSLLGIFQSSAKHEFPLAPKETVEAYHAHQRKIEDAKFELDFFVKNRSAELSEFLAAKTARYLTAAWQVLVHNKPAADTAVRSNLDPQILDRWIAYLPQSNKDHEFLKPLESLLTAKAPIEKAAAAISEFQIFISDVFRRRRDIEERNYVKLGGIKGIRDERTRQYTNLESLPILEYYLWRDLASDPYRKDFFDFKGGVYYYGEKDIDRWLSPEWKDHLDRLRLNHKNLKDKLPAQYPFIHTLRESEKPKNARIAIRGDAQNLGDEVPRHFLTALSKGEPAIYTQGSGRLQLAEAVADPDNPLTARVIVNRLWHGHFGRGIVASTSNFGQLGERPSHPELLDYLAHRLIQSGWSLKAIHREIMLTEAYALSSDLDQTSYARDPSNKFLWRANIVQRLDAEALRDSVLAVSGDLDTTAGGPPTPFADGFRRRAVYGYIGRTKPDPMLTLFDFPNPNTTSETRAVTVGPLQRLFFMNNSFIAAQATKLAARLSSQNVSDDDRIEAAYRLLFSRPPKPEEIKLGRDFLSKTGSWPQYAQVLLSSTEFSSIP